MTLRRALRIERQFDVGLTEKLVVDVCAVGCAVCGHVANAANLDPVALRAVTGAVVSAGVANGQTLRLLRLASGLQANAAATLLLIGKGTLSRWENSHRPPAAHTWVVMALLALESSGERPPVERILESLRCPKPLARIQLTLVDGGAGAFSESRQRAVSR